MQARTSIALAALLVLSGVVVARTAEPPDNVVAAVADAVQQCKDAEGTPNADAVLSVDDVNGDGGEDWIVDYAKLTCDGGINPMCGSGGCTLQIYLWDGATAWNLAPAQRHLWRCYVRQDERQKLPRHLPRGEGRHRPGEVRGVTGSGAPARASWPRRFAAWRWARQSPP